MNYCHKCQSHYEKPGTCNCFAEKPAPQPVAPIVPWYPAYPWYPWYPGTAPVYEPYRITWWCGDPEGTTWISAPNGGTGDTFHIYTNGQSA